jgi:hypothetical protein
VHGVYMPPVQAPPPSLVASHKGMYHHTAHLYLSPVERVAVTGGVTPSISRRVDPQDDGVSSSLPSSAPLSRSLSRSSLSRSRVSAKSSAADDKVDESAERRSDALVIKSGEDWNSVRMGRRWEGGEKRGEEKAFLSMLDGTSASSLVSTKEMVERERGGVGIARAAFLASGAPYLDVPSFAELVTDCGKLKVRIVFSRFLFSCLWFDFAALLYTLDTSLFVLAVGRTSCEVEGGGPPSTHLLPNDEDADDLGGLSAVLQILIRSLGWIDEFGGAGGRRERLSIE